MLRLPREGFQPSITAHNVSLNALIEWIEGSIAFADDRVTQSDVIDILIEEGIYRSQGFAMERLETAWTEVTRRQRVLGSFCPYSVSGPRIRRVLDWRETAAYSFCLLLAMQLRYREELDALVPADYNTQGILFEKLTVAALQGRGMAVHSTAWSKVASASIQQRIADLANHLGERAIEGGIDQWAEPQIKDGGLDVVCHLPFADRWGGRPLYLVQCASGENWRGKKATPKIALWEKLVDFTTRPLRGIAIPFALLENEFRREANYDQLAILLDRHRLAALPVEDPATWPAAPLRAELNAWTQPRVDALPRAEH